MAQYNFAKNDATVSITLTPYQEQVIADRVESVGDWLEGFANNVFAKIDVAEAAVARSIVDKALRDGTADTLPATHKAVAEAVFAQPGYKNRAERKAARGAPPR